MQWWTLTAGEVILVGIKMILLLVIAGAEPGHTAYFPVSTPQKVYIKKSPSPVDWMKTSALLKCWHLRPE